VGFTTQSHKNSSALKPWQLGGQRPKTGQSTEEEEEEGEEVEEEGGEEGEEEGEAEEGEE
jgi:hypothetical protein